MKSPNQGPGLIPVSKKDFWDWSKGPQNAGVGLISQRTGTNPSILLTPGSIPEPQILTLGSFGTKIFLILGYVRLEHWLDTIISLLDIEIELELSIWSHK